MVRLPEWTETFEAFNLSQAEFPHFSMHSGLKKLQIKHSNLQYIHPLAFQPLPGIEELILSDNLIEKLPKNILQTMRNLKVLDLSGNKINGLEGIGGQLATFQPLPGIEELILSDNLIEKLPTNILQTMRNLKVLDLSGNKINGLEGIGGQLGRLNLKNNPWTFCSLNMELLEIGNIGVGYELNLRGCKKLKWLHADNNKFDRLSFGESSGPEKLLSISLNSNHFKEWPESLLDVSHSLIILNLANNLINYLPENGKLLMTLFPCLEQLDLSGNKLSRFEAS
uniref:Uncharacterized protein n=1 Tax=Meloidogyne javanica TaxID=6303 RepID=A0A915N560_MELJA